MNEVEGKYVDEIEVECLSIYSRKSFLLLMLMKLTSDFREREFSGRSSIELGKASQLLKWCDFYIHQIKSTATHNISKGFMFFSS